MTTLTSETVRPKTTFNIFQGVFLPTLLTILGAVMYLRTGWVVGKVGLLGGLLIITLASTITLCTGLSISVIATNIRVGAGGSFSIISQSLGLEVGGSVSLPFYLAQAISVAFYIFAFAEGWQTLFPTHPTVLVLFVAYGSCFAVAFISVGLAAKLRFPILFLITFSLISAALGATTPFRSEALMSPQLLSSEIRTEFWQVFAVFFPAVTGALAGVNLSGTLKEPRKSIPVGTIGAIVVSYVVYMGLAYWTSLVASPQELVENFSVMVDKAAYGWAVQVGILAATFSAALNSLIGAPRVLQAMAAHDVVPFGAKLAHNTEKGEPHYAMYLTGLIGIATILFGLIGGGLNRIAPLMTMFFLSTYAVLNGVVVLEQSLRLTSFRPHFRVPRYVPIIGFFGCVVVMLLINPIFSLVASIIILLLYRYLAQRHLDAPWSDVRSGMFVTMAEWSARRVLRLPHGQDRAWKPALLVPIQSIAALRHSYRFLEAITLPNGTLHILGCYEKDQRAQLEPLLAYEQQFNKDGVFARVALVEARRFRYTLQTAMEVFVSAFFRPNTLFFSVTADTTADKLQFILEHSAEYEMGVLLYCDNPDTGLGREQVINIWIREQSPKWEVGLRLSNLDLALLLGYQLAANWQGQINLITVVNTADDVAAGEAFMKQLIDYGRMPRNTCSHVVHGSFETFLPQAPEADLNIFGLIQTADPHTMVQLIQQTKSTCVFVRDSGFESALA